MVRVLAGHDPSRFDAVMRWPLREALVALRERVRERELSAWRFEMLVWSVFKASGGKGRAPEPPRILR